MGRPTQFHDPFNREGRRRGSPGLRAPWWLIKVVTLGVLVFVMFAWPWFLPGIGLKIVIATIWYVWILFSFFGYVRWVRTQKA